MSYILFATYGNSEANKAAKILTEEGYTVVVTSDGKEALEVLEKDTDLPAVIFTHLMLPNCDGLELTCTFRRDYPRATTKILMGTVRCANSFACHDWNWPLEGFVMCPYSAEQLALSVEQLLHRDISPFRSPHI